MTKRKKYTEVTTCKECGKEFTIRRSWQRFCTPDCRMSYFITHGKETRDDINVSLQDKRHQMLESKAAKRARNIALIK
jgi:hypothetical protein